MSTRSRIGILNDDGTVTSIYCHHDGYVGYVGEMLNNFYNDELAVRKLMLLGDISSLGALPKGNADLWKPTNYDGGWYAGSMHGRLSAFYCCTYKDRGETDVDAMISRNLSAYLHIDNISIEYSYLFTKGVWYVDTGENGKHELQLLSNLIKED